ncbi:MAG: DUF4416 family protein [bacterium]|nr:DUF4416 family protein [bacterium]
MGKIYEERPVKYVAGLLYKSGMEKALELLVPLMGDIDGRSEETDFSFTDYYGKEMGRGLKRVFVSFEKLQTPALLADIKTGTNKLELDSSKSGRRVFNIDPGYIDLSKLVVASTKDATYRVYVKNGIFAQGMLYFEDDSYRPWSWTYRDYKEDFSIRFFNATREIYRQQAEICRR